MAGVAPYLQLLSLLDLKLAYGTGTFTGNGTAGVNPTPAIDTHIGRTLLVALAGPNPTGAGGAWGGYMSPVGVANNSLQFAANTNGLFANATTYAFYWIAIG